MQTTYLYKRPPNAKAPTGFLTLAPCVCGCQSRKKDVSGETITFTCKTCGLSASGKGTCNAIRNWNLKVKENKKNEIKNL